MRACQLIIVLSALVIGSSPTLAQFVKGNQAVKLLSDGTKKVETPPTTGALLAQPCPAAKPSCSGGGWKMVETNAGLMECTEAYARPGTCRTSTYGTEKRSRLWVVQKDSQWMYCQYPDVSSKCTSIKSLPFSAVQ